MRIRMHWVKRLAVLPVFLICIAVVISTLVGFSQASAEILLEDDFEDPSRSNSIWGFKNPSDFKVVLDSAKAQSGNGVVEMQYNPNTTGPGFKIVVFPKAVPEIYIRWSERYSPGWTWSGVAQKILFVNRGAKSIFEGLAMTTKWGGDQPVVSSENFSTPLPVLTQNLLAKGLGDGQWHCLEWYVNAGPSGSIKLWIDGELRMDHPDVPLPFSVLEGIILSGYYNAGGSTPSGVPHLQYRWVDDFVVSTNRIGCLPATADETPPKAPTGVQIIGQ